MTYDYDFDTLQTQAVGKALAAKDFEQAAALRGK